MVKCPNCGAPMNSNECSYCHYIAPIANPQPTINMNVTNTYVEAPKSNVRYTPNVSPKNKLVALILCIFLGGFGIHKFYVGKVGMGIVYFLTLGLFGIGWVIDIILILCGAFKDSNNLPLK